MHIARLRLKGFKSFGSEVCLEFGPHVNVIVGHNGSGKSNLVEAISVALSTTTLVPRTREMLLHDGARGTALIEVTINNDDGRLPGFGKTVVIQREINGKADKFTIDGKMITRDVLQSALESGGFSQSNPFYIVRQGQVMALALCSDERRLQVMRELAGDQAFDAKRREANMVMHNSNAELNEVSTAMIELREYAEELEKEVEKMKTFKALEKEKQALDFEVVTRNTAHHRAKLEALRRDKATALEGLAAAKKAREKAHARNSDYEAKITQLEAEKSEEGAIVDLLRDQIEKLLRQESKLQERISKAEDETNELRVSIPEAERSLKALEVAIEGTEVKVKNLEKRKEEASKTFVAAEAALEEAKQKHQDFFARRGRSQQFRSTDERNEFIRNEMAVVERAMAEKKIGLEHAEDALRQVHAKKAECEEKLRIMPADRRDLSLTESNHKSKARELRNELFEIERKRQDLAFQLAAKMQLKFAAKEALEAARQKLFKRKDVRMLLIGCESLEVLMNEDAISSEAVLGMAADLIEADPAVHTALSVALGRKLFYIVVQSAAEATRIAKQAKARALPGEFYFVAVDKLRQDERALPEATADTKPLLSVLACDETPGAVEALRFLCGRTVLARNSSLFRQLQQQGLDGVTPDGQQAFKTGVLAGGYHKPGASLYALYKEYTTLKLQLLNLEDAVGQLQTRMNSLDEDRRKCEEVIQSEKTKAFLIEVKLRDLDGREKIGKRELDELEDDEKELKRGIDSKVLFLKQEATKLASLRDEMAGGASASEAEGVRICKEVQVAKKECKSAFEAKNRCERSWLDVKRHLEVELYEKRKALQTRICSDELEAKAQKLDQFREQLRLTSEDLKTVSLKRDELEETSRKSRQELEALLRKRDETAEKLANAAGEMEDRLAALESLSLRETDLEEKLREGVPAQTHDQKLLDSFKKWSTAKCLRESAKLAARLEKFGSINLAADHQREELLRKLKVVEKRYELLSHEKGSIEELLKAIELQREEKINFTCTQVSKYFSEVFSLLVPSGKGVIRLQRNEDRSFSGLSLHVRFGPGEEIAQLKQLSGGQKALTALALIFAIQKCDPAPFYVFDEVDAALDCAHRARVGHFLAAQNSQFICTSFRKELVLVAEVHVGVNHSGKASHAEIVDAEHALDFIERE